MLKKISKALSCAIICLLVFVGCELQDSGKELEQKAPGWCIGTWQWSQEFEGGETNNRSFTITENSFMQDADNNSYVFGEPTANTYESFGGETETYWLIQKVTKSTGSVFEITTFMSDKEDGEYNDLGPHYRVTKSNGKLYYEHWMETVNDKTVWSEKAELTRAE